MLTAATNTKQRWHRDLLVFALLCTLWSALLIFRVVIRDPFSSQASPFQDVFFGEVLWSRGTHHDDDTGYTILMPRLVSGFADRDGD